MTLFSNVPSAASVADADYVLGLQGSTGPGTGNTAKMTLQQIVNLVGTGPFSSLSVTGNASIGGALTAGAVTAPVSSATAISSISSTPRTLADRFAEVVNVKDFGAKGDGSTDDTAAINSALDYIRSHFGTPVGNSRTFRLVFPAATYVVTSPLNFTGIVSNNGGMIDGCGSQIWAKFSSPGGAIIDCLGSRWLRFYDLNLYGDSAFPASIGIQIGRNTTAAADYHNFHNVTVTGYFSFTSFYNLASETCGYYSCQFRNLLTSDNAYCVVMDGLNHWGATSTFVSVTIPVETPNSFNENVFTNCVWQGNSNVVVWIGTTSRHKYISCYGSTVRGTIFVIYTPSSGVASTYLDIDCHCETTGLQYAFLMTGVSGKTSGNIGGFSFKDHLCYASSSIFALDPLSSLTSFSLRSVDLMVCKASSVNPTLFDVPSKWSCLAKYGLFDTNMFNAAPGNWSGRVENRTFPGPIYVPANQTVVATNNGQITVFVQSEWISLTPASSIAQYTVNMPLGPGGISTLHGTTIMISSTQTITNLTVSPNTGQAVGAQPGTLTGGTCVTYRYDGGSSTWLMLGKTST